MASSENDDRPGVTAPPPVIFAAAALIGVGLEYLWRSSFDAALWPFGAMLIALGVAGIGFAFHLFRRAGTHPDPYRPDEALVTRGLFRFTRNPFYVGLGMIQAGLAFVFDSPWVSGQGGAGLRRDALRCGRTRGGPSRTPFRRRLPRLQSDRAAVALSSADPA